MFAVIRTGGKQYKIQEGDIIEVEKITDEAGKKFDFNEVLLVELDGKTLIGTPVVKNALVRAEILETIKDKKVVVFKKKRRKQYRLKRGHRQELSRVRIQKIVTGHTAGSTSATKQKTEDKKPAKKETGAKKDVSGKTSASKPESRKTGRTKSGSQKTGKPVRPSSSGTQTKK